MGNIEVTPLRIGQKVPFLVPGLGGYVQVSHVSPEGYRVTNGKMFKLFPVTVVHKKLRAMQRQRLFPLPYAEVDYLEHFCESFGMYALGTLTGEHKNRFEEALGVRVAKTASQYPYPQREKITPELLKRINSTGHAYKDVPNKYGVPILRRFSLVDRVGEIFTTAHNNEILVDRETLAVNGSHPKYCWNIRDAKTGEVQEAVHYENLAESYLRHGYYETRIANRQAAAPWRDANVRLLANAFYRDLHHFLDVPEEQLRKRMKVTGDGFSVAARDFNDDYQFENVVVRFMPNTGRLTGGVGRTPSGRHAVVFSVMIGPGDLRYLRDRVSFKLVAHEVAHLQDAGLFRAEGSASKADVGNDAGYYNSPGEWNAFWHEGAADVERFSRNDSMKNPQVKEHFFGDGSLTQFAKKVSLFWDKDFLAEMNATTRRKFDKRLAALWLTLKESGVFEKDSQ
jgi:hypothetical protein